MAVTSFHVPSPSRKHGDVADQAAMLALTVYDKTLNPTGIVPGQWVHRLDTGTAWQYQGTDPTVLANWEEWPYPAPPSVPSDTDGLPEGATNLYFTDERAQDAVGAALTDTATIDFTYDDANDQIKADVKDGSIGTAKLGGDITAAGKALLDDATAAAQRTTLGLGSAAVEDALVDPAPSTVVLRTPEGFIRASSLPNKVFALSTVNVDVNAPGLSLGGVAYPGYPVLVALAKQILQGENGVWVWGGATPLTRDDSFKDMPSHVGIAIGVMAGTYADTLWLMTGSMGGLLDTDPITVTRIGPFDPSTLGLGTAAYANTTAFDAAGAATTAEGNAKAYASQEADTIYIPGVLLNGTITVLFHARHAGKVVSLTHQLEGGTCSLTAKIGGTNIIGIASVSASTTKTTSTATAASTYSAGAIIEVTIASVSSAKGLRLALYRDRAV